jgi:hypothetical protein
MPVATSWSATGSSWNDGAKEPVTAPVRVAPVAVAKYANVRRRATVWAARAALAIATAAAFALRAPDAGALAVARGFGARIAREGRIPLRLGPEIFGAPAAFDGGLGWLGALTAWLASAAGPVPALFATCAVALAGLALVELRARRRAPRILALGAAALAASCAVDALREGGGIENAAFAAGLYLLLERPGARGAVGAALLTAVWCNASPQGLFAPALATLAALGALLERRPSHERRWAWLAVGTTALATLATPAGWAFPALAFEALRIDRGLDGLVPYHPADVSALAYRTGFTLTVIAALAFGAGRLRPSDALLWTGATLLALANGAYLAVFGVLVAPLLAASAADALRLLPPSGGTTSAGRTRAAATAAALLLCVGAGSAGLLRKPAPAEAAVLTRTLASDGREHRLFCANLDWCSVAAASGFAHLGVYADGRVEALPPRVLAVQREVGALKGDWRRLLRANRIDAILVRRDRAFATLLGARPGWRLAGTTATITLFVRQP